MTIQPRLKRAFPRDCRCAQNRQTLWGRMGMDKSLRKGARRPLSGLSHEPAMRSARTLPASCPYRASAGDHDSAGLTRRFKRCFPLSKFHRALLPPAPSAPLPRLLFFPKSLCRPPQNQARTVFLRVFKEAPRFPYSLHILLFPGALFG